MAKLETDVPIFYLYENNGQWTRTDKNLTKDINNHVFRHKGRFDTCGHSFYPQWTKPTDPEQIRTAWMVDASGYQVARTGTVQRDHDRTHRFCKTIGNGECLIQVIRKLRYDPSVRMWVLLPLKDEAGAENTKE